MTAIYLITFLRPKTFASNQFQYTLYSTVYCQEKQKIKLISPSLGLNGALGRLCGGILNILIAHDITCKFPLSFFQTCAGRSIDVMDLGQNV